MVAWQDGLIHLYNTFTIELRREFVTTAAFLETAAYSPDGRYILTGEGWPMFTATLWDAQNGDPLRMFRGHKWSVSAVAFNRDGTTILTGADVLREWSITPITSRLRIEKIPGHTRLTWSLGKLEEASQPTGPWQTLTNAVSPLTIPSTTEHGRFYRVRIDESD
jgi:WD40 repeat protein